jgi:hypothetical protein
MNHVTGVKTGLACLGAIGLIMVTLWAAWRGEFVVPVAAALLVQSVGHFADHVVSLDEINGVGLVVSLTAVPALAFAAHATLVAPPRGLP